MRIRPSHFRPHVSVLLVLFFMGGAACTSVPYNIGSAEEGVGFMPAPKEIEREPLKVTRKVRATAYNAMEGQTDSTPEICAWGDKIRPGIIAISRDLEYLGLRKGTVVEIEGLGKRTVLDRMHRRKRNQIDLYMEEYGDAINFGVKEVSISWYVPEESWEDET